MGNYTDQERFWEGDFGDEYTVRNTGSQMVASSINLFSRVLQHTNKISSCIEIGSNRGINLEALKVLIPDIKMKAIEINESAAKICAKIPDVEVFNGSVFEYESKEKYDLAFTCGVLIHIAPEKLDEVYSILYESSNKYIAICEYYNPSPVEVLYRGNNEKLYKRDFAGELLDKYRNLKLIDYGFIYHRDVNFPKDDITYFLMEKC